MQFFLSVIGFFFLVFTIGFMMVVWKVRKRVNDLRDAMQDSMNDEEFQRMADKNYYRKKTHENPTFDKDYFKGNANGRKKEQQQRQQQRRTTRTADGVTIIDDRDPSTRDKKIFARDEGEYVDYVEN